MSVMYIYDEHLKVVDISDTNAMETAKIDMSINEASTLDITSTFKFPDQMRYVALRDPISQRRNTDEYEFLMYRISSSTVEEDDLFSYTFTEFAYDELAYDGYIVEERPNQSTFNNGLDLILKGTKWKRGLTNIEGKEDLDFFYLTPIEAISELNKKFPAEFRFWLRLKDDGTIAERIVNAVNRRGQNTGKRFETTSNLISLVAEDDFTNVYSAIVPRGRGEEIDADGDPNTRPGYGRKISIKDVVWSKAKGDPLNKPKGQEWLALENGETLVDGRLRYKVVNFDDDTDPNVLINHAYAQLLKDSVVKRQFTANAKDLGVSELGDTVQLVDKERKLEYQARIFRVVYDMVDPTNTEVEFGDNIRSESSISNVISNVVTKQDQIVNDTNWAVQQANGKNTNYYGITKPSNPQEGDAWFWEDGENSGIKVFKNGDWVDVVDTQTQERITNEVKNAVDTATAYADKLNSTQAEATNSLADELDKKADELTKSQQNIADQATAYTDSAVADANAKAVQIGQTTAQNAQKALNEKATTLQQSIDAKVAKTEYDKKTGELTTNVNTAQQTANTATQTIGTYKQTNDKRVSAAEANIKANSDAIALTASKEELNKATGELSGSIGDLQVTAKDITQTVSELQTKVNSLGQTNLLNNTEFTPDLEGWELSSNGNVRLPYRSYLQSDIKSVVVGFNTVDTTDKVYALFQQTVQLASTTGSGNKMSLSWASIANRIDNYANVWVRFFDKSGTQVTNYVTKWADTATGNTWKTRKKWENITIPDTAVSVLISFEAREGTNAYLGQPMMVYGETIGDYVQGNYNNNASLAEVKLTADGLRETVNNPKTGLATRLLTAEGSITKVQDATNNLTAQQTLTANGLTQEIADRKTGDSNTLQAGKDFTTSQIKSYDTGMQSQIGQMSDGILATVSVINRVVDSSLLNNLDNWVIGDGDKKWYYSGLTMYKGVSSIGINVTNGNYNLISSQNITTGSFAGNTLYVSVDVLARSIGSTSDDYLEVYLHERDNSNTKTATTNITGRLSTTNNKWVNYRSKITVNSSTKYVFLEYRTHGTANVYVSRPYVGVVELPEGGYTPSANSNNTTVLSLLKDNWKIGIADNIGLITSGIVGDSNSINLISKNVTIDSPNTQIKGTAWITNAMMGNASVSTANIGDLAVTSAKISELDVNKLSGNITNFIRSYWSNAYQNLQIDANAIDFTTSNSRTKIENGSITMWQNAGGYYRLGGLKAMKSSAGGENNHTAGIYLALDEWQTTKNGDKYWNYGGPDFFGGSEIGILHSTGVDGSGNPIYGALMKWSNSLAAGRQEGISKGFNFFDDINLQGHYLLANGAPNKMKLTWISWSDWGNYRNIALTNETSKAGVAMNNDNLVLFGVGKRADATTGWKA